MQEAHFVLSSRLSFGWLSAYTNGSIQLADLQNRAGRAEMSGVRYLFCPNIPSSATMAYGVHAISHTKIITNDITAIFTSMRCLSLDRLE